MADRVTKRDRFGREPYVREPRDRSGASNGPGAAPVGVP
ncbi:hypothetical protein CDS [Bradyrhizobium sp.]|nr:hypothetical protein CDS [Bradyrhizobium sp.]